jgi:hypothetical protein
MSKRKITDSNFKVGFRADFKSRKSAVPQLKLNHDGTLTLKFTYIAPDKTKQEIILSFDSNFSYVDDPQEYVHTLTMISGDISIFHLLTNGAKPNKDVIIKYSRGGSLQVWFRFDTEVVYNDESTCEEDCEYVVFDAGVPGGAEGYASYIGICVGCVKNVSVEFKPKQM